MAHLAPVKTHSTSMSGSQSLQDQSAAAPSDAASTGSPRPEMPRQNSDPTSDSPGPPQPMAGREDRDRERDRTAWLREEDLPPKVRKSEERWNRRAEEPSRSGDTLSLCLCAQVPQRTTSISPALVRKNSPNGGGGPRTGSQLIRAR